MENVEGNNRAWDIYSAKMEENKQKPARPWDLLNKNIGRVETVIAEKRMSICKECPRLIKTTSQCKECGCIMTLKTKLPNAFCPIGKWHKEEITYKEEIN